MAAYTVKNFNSTMIGAPSLSGTPNTLIEVLKACLITGFNQKTVVSANIVSGVCTLELEDNNQFQPNTVILINGAEIEGLNGEHWLDEVNNNKLIFKVTRSDISNIPGNIVVKYAPVGEWTMPYTATSVAAFKSTHPHSADAHIVIDDTAARHATVRIYRGMTAIDSYDSYVPKGLQPEVMYLKSMNADTEARQWKLIADGKTVYLFICPGKADNASGVWMSYCFGTFTTEGYATRLNCIITGSVMTTNLAASTSVSSLGTGVTNSYSLDYSSMSNISRFYSSIAMVDPATGAAGASCWHTPERWVSGGIFTSGMSTNINDRVFGSSINRPNNKIYTSDMLIRCGENIIGRYPGLKVVLNDIRPRAAEIIGKCIDGAYVQDGRLLYCMPATKYESNFYTNTNADNLGIALFDATGPWQ